MYMMGAQGSGKVEEIEGMPQSMLKDDHKIYDGGWVACMLFLSVCLSVCVCLCMSMRACVCVCCGEVNNPIILTDYHHLSLLSPSPSSLFLFLQDVKYTSRNARTLPRTIPPRSLPS